MHQVFLHLLLKLTFSSTNDLPLLINKGLAKEPPSTSIPGKNTHTQQQRPSPFSKKYK